MTTETTATTEAQAPAAKGLAITPLVTAPSYPFFCYGTLRPGWGNSRCWIGNGWAEHDGVASVTGLRLVGFDNPFPYAVPTGDPADRTVGAIIRSAPGVGRYAEMMHRFDTLEGYPTHYDRQTVEVDTPDGPVTCWVYVVPRDSWSQRRAAHMELVPGGDWSAAHAAEAVR